MSRAEWRWLLGWCGLTLGLTALPFVWGWLTTPPDHQFTGVLFNGLDTNTYLAKMDEGRHGEWVFRLAHTSEGGDAGAITYVYYLLLGKLAGLLNLSNILMFHIARLLNGLLLLLASYGFIRLLFPTPKQQHWAFYLVCFASGLGWLTIALGWLTTPPDFIVAEAYTFLSIFANPHFPLATALTILAIAGWLFGREGRGWIYYIEAAISTFLLGFIHPFMLVAVGAVLGLFWLRLARTERKLDWSSFIALAGIGLAGGPGPLLTWWGTNADPVLKQWMAQNQTPTLDLPQTLVGYGLLTPFALAGIWWVERRLPRQALKESVSDPAPEATSALVLRWQLVTTWVGATIILLILPVSFSRRFEEGLHLPLCCLAAVGWFKVVLPRLQRGWQKPLQVGLPIIMAVSSLAMIVMSTAFLYLPADDSASDPVRAPYFSAGETGAIDWLNQHGQNGAVVLTGPLLGNVLPGRAPVRVLYGHPMETLYPAQKLALVETFFAISTTSTTRYGIINSWDLKYLVYGWREQKLGSFDPSTGGWPLVYNLDGVQIYQLS